MNKSRLCIMVFAASLASGAFAKPVLHVMKMSASGDDSAFANTQVVTTNSYGYIEEVDVEELKKSAPPKPSWLKETKSKQTFKTEFLTATDDIVIQWKIIIVIFIVY